MARWTAVEIAEFVARKRAWGGALAAVLFLVVEVLSRPPLLQGEAVRRGIDWWMIYAVTLLLLVATGGGLLWNRQIRALVNDEVARAQRRAAVVVGYWSVVLTALLVYCATYWFPLSGRGAAWLILTPGVVVPLLVFAWLDFRALRHG